MPRQDLKAEVSTGSWVTPLSNDHIDAPWRVSPSTPNADWAFTRRYPGAQGLWVRARRSPPG